MDQTRRVSNEELRSRLKRTLDEHIFQGITGASMAVSVPGFERMLLSSGMADLDGDTPVRPDHLFKIASITKTFVAAVIVQLVQEGKLDLSTTLDRWFPDLPNARFITLRQVLIHQSGIPDREYDLVRRDPPKDSIWTLKAIVDRAYDTNPVRAPGEYAYSNTNCMVLGMLIQKVTGESRVVQVRKRVLDPLALLDTCSSSEEGYSKERLARGYVHDSGRPEDVTELFPMTFAGPSGDMISTADDVLRWWEAIFEGKAVGKQHFDEFVTAQNHGTYPGTAMSGHGLGTMIFSYNDLEVIGYRGSLPGYVAIVGTKGITGLPL